MIDLFGKFYEMSNCNCWHETHKWALSSHQYSLVLSFTESEIRQFLKVKELKEVS